MTINSNLLKMFPLTVNNRLDRKRDKSHGKSQQERQKHQPHQHEQQQETLGDEKSFLITIIKAHEETCDYTRAKVGPLIEKSHYNPIYARCSKLMSCPLNPLPPPAPPPFSNEGTNSECPHRLSPDPAEGVMEDFSSRFSPAIRGVVEFAKRIPGFGLLSQDDQVILLKAGVFEVLLVRLACMFDRSTDSMLCLNGMILQRDSFQSHAKARFLLDSMFTFSERFNSLSLTDPQIALLCAIIILSPDRPGLSNVDLIDKLNVQCIRLLDQSSPGFSKPGSLSSSSTIRSNQPTGLLNCLISLINDLRTLNQLHSEKLLTYKMGPKNGSSSSSSSSYHLSTTSSPSPCSSSSSSLSNHNGNSNSSIERNCNSPPSINPSSSPYASLLPVQWQNFTIRDTNDGPSSSSSSSSSSSNVNCSYGLNEEESLSSSGSKERNSVTSSDTIYKAKKSANGLPCNFNSEDSERIPGDHNNSNEKSSNNDSKSNLLASNYILGQRLLKSTNSNSSSNYGHINSNNHHHHHHRRGSRDNIIHRYHDNKPQTQNQQSQPLQSHGTGTGPSHHLYESYFSDKNRFGEDYKMRRVDSPTDSGIESGKDQCNGSTPTTSVCSSPISACEDKVKDIVSDSEGSISEKTGPESIDDMPMLKRALQAPPLINTNMLMDEAYRHHKKFRATKASRDCEPASSSTLDCPSFAPSPLNNNNNSHRYNYNNSNNSYSSCLSSPTSISSSTASPNSTNNNNDSLASTHSTLVKLLEQAPRYIGELSAHRLSTLPRQTLEHHHYQHDSLSPSSTNPSNHINCIPKDNKSYQTSSTSDPSHPNLMGSADLTMKTLLAKVGPAKGSRTGSMPPPLDLSRKRDLLYL